KSTSGPETTSAQGASTVATARSVGLFSTTPSAPSSPASRRSTMVRAKFGSAIVGAATSRLPGIGSIPSWWHQRRIPGRSMGGRAPGDLVGVGSGGENRADPVDQGGRVHSVDGLGGRHREIGTGLGGDPLASARSGNALVARQ